MTYVSKDSTKCKNEFSARILPKDFLTCEKINKITNEFPKAYIKSHRYDYINIYIPLENLNEEEFNYYNNTETSEFCLAHQKLCKMEAPSFNYGEYQKHACSFSYKLE